MEKKADALRRDMMTEIRKMHEAIALQVWVSLNPKP
jgi:hypothetical protein